MLQLYPYLYQVIRKHTEERGSADAKVIAHRHQTSKEKGLRELLHLLTNSLKKI